MRCGESGIPDGAVEPGGRIVDAAGLGGMLRQLLARSEITTSRALIAASDTIASFRVFTFPKGTPDAEVDMAVRTQLPTTLEHLAVHRTEVLGDGSDRTVYATVWDRNQVRAIADTARHAGLEPAVVELKSLCVARAVPVASCIVLDLYAEPFEATVIDRHIPRVWHSFSAKLEGDLAASLAAGLKPVLGFYKGTPGGGFAQDSPILIRSDQVLPTLMAGRLATLTGHPVESLPRPPRIDPELRFGPYLTCVGLVMRRKA